PSDRPISGSRFGPNTNKTTRAKIAICQGLRSPGVTRYDRTTARLRPDDPLRKISGEEADRRVPSRYVRAHRDRHSTRALIRAPLRAHADHRNSGGEAAPRRSRRLRQSAPSSPRLAYNIEAYGWHA